ncbi:MAG: hypothetical protein K0S40_3307 [Actinomycetospora sp.]|jgi:hypothetical protein|nr:hypothetical protein [Actinomycetospora sp.]
MRIALLTSSTTQRGGVVHTLALAAAHTWEAAATAHLTLYRRGPSVG